MTDREHRARLATAALPEIERFVDVAFRFCEIIEDWVRANFPPAFPALFFDVEALLPELYSAATRLPPHGAWFEEDTPTPHVRALPEALDGLIESIRQRLVGPRQPRPNFTLMQRLEVELKEWNHYETVFNPYGEADEHQVTHGLHDDIESLYTWLRHGLETIAGRRGYPETRLFNACFEWEHEFVFHDGAHLVRCLMALYYVLHYMPERMRD